MKIQSYLIVENNVVTNTIMWDGGPEWTPPAGSIQLVTDITPAITWVYNFDLNLYELKEEMGKGGIGFTWNGSVLTTNEKDPNISG